MVKRLFHQFNGSNLYHPTLDKEIYAQHGLLVYKIFSLQIVYGCLWDTRLEELNTYVWKYFPNNQNISKNIDPVVSFCKM